MHKYNCVYSIGARCGTEMILKEMDLTRFSSVFGSCEISNIDNIIKCLDSRFDLLFNPAHLLFTKDIPQFAPLNEKYGNRTLNKNFDNITEWHGATIAHYDLSEESKKDHCERATGRFYKLMKNNIPTLFVFTGPNVELNKCRELSERFQRETENFHILFCNFVEGTSPVEQFSDPFFTIYDVHHERELHTILKIYDLTDLIRIDEIDSLRLFVV
jgi:hypothetical protein